MRQLLVILGITFLFFALAEANPQTTYTVLPGDTLYDIALAHGTSWQQLASLNKVKDPTKLQIGTVLRLPGYSAAHLVCWDGTIHEITNKERDLLIKLVDAEARGEPMEGQIAVAAVVLNRVRHRKFPNTIWDVIHQPGQFSPIEFGSLPNRAKDSSAEAVERALQGEDPSGGALYFYNPATSESLDYWRTKPVLKKIGNHNFAV